MNQWFWAALIGALAAGVIAGLWLAPLLGLGGF